MNKTEAKTIIVLESDDSFTLIMPAELCQELREHIPAEQIEEVNLEGVRHAIRREQCRQAVKNQKEILRSYIRMLSCANSKLSQQRGSPKNLSWICGF